MHIGTFIRVGFLRSWENSVIYNVLFLQLEDSIFPSCTYPVFLVRIITRFSQIIHMHYTYSALYAYYTFKVTSL